MGDSVALICQVFNLLSCISSHLKSDVGDTGKTSPTYLRPLLKKLMARFVARNPKEMVRQVNECFLSESPLISSLGGN